MKKIGLFIGVLIGFLFFESCSKNDKNIIDVNLNKVVGIWKPIKEGEIYIDQTVIENQYNECSQKSRIIFLENGTLQFKEFAEDEITNICDERVEPVLTFGSWEETNSGYRLITTYTYTANQQSYTDDGIPEIFTFSNNNTSLRIGYADNEIINGNQLEFHYTDFVKIE